MTRQQFRDALCILRSIDAHELGDPQWWPQFRDDPYLFYLRCDDKREALIWAVVEARSHPQEVKKQIVQVMVNGDHFDSDAVAGLMDDELREELHSAKNWASEQDFVDAYCAAHERKFGEAFVVN
jgi:hypothetical protein